MPKRLGPAHGALLGSHHSGHGDTLRRSLAHAGPNQEASDSPRRLAHGHGCGDQLRGDTRHLAHHARFLKALIQTCVDLLKLGVRASHDLGRIHQARARHLGHVAGDAGEKAGRVIGNRVLAALQRTTHDLHAMPCVVSRRDLVRVVVERPDFPARIVLDPVHHQAGFNQIHHVGQRSDRRCCVLVAQRLGKGRLNRGVVLGDILGRTLYVYLRAHLRVIQAADVHLLRPLRHGPQTRDRVPPLQNARLFLGRDLGLRRHRLSLAIKRGRLVRVQHDA